MFRTRPEKTAIAHFIRIEPEKTVYSFPNEMLDGHGELRSHTGFLLIEKGSLGREGEIVKPFVERRFQATVEETGCTNY
jgi:hypothetical protein